MPVPGTSYLVDLLRAKEEALALLATLFAPATAAPPRSRDVRGVSVWPSMSRVGVSGSIDGVIASCPEAPAFPAPCFMTGEEFCEMVAAHLANPPKAWDW